MKKATLNRDWLNKLLWLAVIHFVFSISSEARAETKKAKAAKTAHEKTDSEALEKRKAEVEAVVREKLKEMALQHMMENATHGAQGPSSAPAAVAAEIPAEASSVGKASGGGGEHKQSANCGTYEAGESCFSNHGGEAADQEPMGETDHSGEEE